MTQTDATLVDGKHYKVQGSCQDTLQDISDTRDLRARGWQDAQRLHDTLLPTCGHLVAAHAPGGAAGHDFMPLFFYCTNAHCGFTIDTGV